MSNDQRILLLVQFDERLIIGGTVSRIQLALNVDDIEAATTFYSRLLGTEPAKTRPGYANFAVTDPPLKLVLLENPGQGGSLNHLGVEVPDVDTVDVEQARLAGHGLSSVDERGTTCCYARQDKFWVEGTPDGERWEVYTVLADSPTFSSQDGPACCAESDAQSNGQSNVQSNGQSSAEPAAACC
jgi:catechol 2,3-dioxygenase-like lactoylglutathione lyase family enzyme